MSSPPDVGLPNLGNTCFLNSIVQALGSCSSVKSYLNNVVVKQEHYSKKSIDGNSFSKSYFAVVVDALARGLAQAALYSLILLKGDEAWRSHEAPTEDHLKQIARQRQQRYLSQCSVSKALLGVVGLLADPSSSCVSGDVSPSPDDLRTALRAFMGCLARRAKDGDEDEGDPLFSNDGEQQDAMEALEMLCNATWDELQAWEGLVGRWIQDPSLELADLERASLTAPESQAVAPPDEDLVAESTSNAGDGARSRIGCQLAVGNSENNGVTASCEQDKVEEGEGAGASDEETASRKMSNESSASLNVLAGRKQRQGELRSSASREAGTDQDDNDGRLKPSRHIPSAALAAAAALDSLASCSPSWTQAAGRGAGPCSPLDSTDPATAAGSKDPRASPEVGSCGSGKEAVGGDDGGDCPSLTSLKQTWRLQERGSALLSPSSAMSAASSSASSSSSPSIASSSAHSSSARSSSARSSSASPAAVEIPEPSGRLTHPLQGLSSSTLVCCTCGNRSTVQIQPFWALSVALPPPRAQGVWKRGSAPPVLSLYECLGSSFCSEILQEVTCAKCSLRAAAFELEDMLAYPDDQSTSSSSSDDDSDKDGGRAEGSKVKSGMPFPPGDSSSSLSRRPGGSFDGGKEGKKDDEREEESQNIKKKKKKKGTIRDGLQAIALSRAGRQLPLPDLEISDELDGLKLCRATYRASRRMVRLTWLSRTPRVLCIHLQRSVWASAAAMVSGVPVKDARFVQFPVTLDVRRFRHEEFFDKISEQQPQQQQQPQHKAPYGSFGGASFGGSPFGAAASVADAWGGIHVTPCQPTGGAVAASAKWAGEEKGGDSHDDNAQVNPKNQEEEAGGYEGLEDGSSSEERLQLRAVVVHLGTHSSFGHYVVYRRWDERSAGGCSGAGRRNGDWLRVSDDAVSWASEAEVLSQVAALLFYERIEGRS